MLLNERERERKITATASVSDKPNVIDKNIDRFFSKAREGHELFAPRDFKYDFVLWSPVISLSRFWHVGRRIVETCLWEPRPEQRSVLLTHRAESNIVRESPF